MAEKHIKSALCCTQPLLANQLMGVAVQCKQETDLYKDSHFLVTFRLQEAWDTQAVMGYPEGVLQILSGCPKQCLPHVHKARVNGLNDSQEGQTTRPALPKVLHCHTKPTG